MILSASRRTDIPAFFCEWFFRRIEEGFALVKNPMNPAQIRKVPMSKDDVDCIVFWTKNPAAMISDLEKLSGYNYYFQFTITPYANDMEPGLPAKEEIIETFKRLSNMLGAHRVIWRYDPVLVNAQYGENRHIESFAAMAKSLSGFTEKCVISFVDTYPKMLRRMEGSGPYELSLEAKLEMAKAFAKAAGENSICVEACTEEVDFSGCGIGKTKCIDGQLAERIAGRPVAAKKDRSQRKECGCAASMDIGAYNTCLHGCLYCYANSAGRPSVMKTLQNHDKLSPFLIV